MTLMALFSWISGLVITFLEAREMYQMRENSLFHLGLVCFFTVNLEDLHGF